MTYFIKIDESRELRKALLESSKLSITILKNEQELITLREKKKQILENARREFKKISSLLLELERSLPKMSKKDLEELRPKKSSSKSIKKQKNVKHNDLKNLKNSKKKSVKKGFEEKGDLSKLEKLEDSLKMIEERLNKL